MAVVPVLPEMRGAGPAMVTIPPADGELERPRLRRPGASGFDRLLERGGALPHAHPHPTPAPGQLVQAKAQRIARRGWQGRGLHRDLVANGEPGEVHVLSAAPIRAAALPRGIGISSLTSSTAVVRHLPLSNTDERPKGSRSRRRERTARPTERRRPPATGGAAVEALPLTSAVNRLRGPPRRSGCRGVDGREQLGRRALGAVGGLVFRASAPRSQGLPQMDPICRCVRVCDQSSTIRPGT
jgi:hypothetical protein